MNNIKDALLQVVKAARLALEMDEHLARWGGDNPYREIYGLIYDGIAALVGDKSETVDTSPVHTALTAPFLEDERRASCLDYIHDVNFSQPAPHVSENDHFAEPKTGYKFRETPEGDWEEEKESDNLGIIAKAMTLSQENDSLKQALRECGNELCFLCGKYHREHEGACDGCKWRYVKDGEMPG